MRINVTILTIIFLQLLSCTKGRVNKIDDSFLKSTISNRINQLNQSQGFKFNFRALDIELFENKTNEIINSLYHSNVRYQHCLDTIFNFIGESNMTQGFKESSLKYFESIEEDDFNVIHNINVFKLMVYDELIINSRSPYYCNKVEPFIIMNSYIDNEGTHYEAQIHLRLIDTSSDYRIVHSKDSQREVYLNVEDGFGTYKAVYSNSKAKPANYSAYFHIRNEFGENDSVPFTIDWGNLNN